MRVRGGPRSPLTPSRLLLDGDPSRSAQDDPKLVGVGPGSQKRDAVSALLRDADDGVNVEVRAVRHNVVAINTTPFITTWRRVQVIVAVVDSLAALPVLVADR